MPRKRYSTEQIVTKLRQAEVELGRGLRVPQMCKKLGISEIAPKYPISLRANRSVRCVALPHLPTPSGSCTFTVSFRICFEWVGTCSGRCIIGCCEHDHSPCGPR